jgi:hypothetical protein
VQQNCGLFDHLVGGAEQGERDGQAERLGWQRSGWRRHSLSNILWCPTTGKSSRIHIGKWPSFPRNVKLDACDGASRLRDATHCHAISSKISVSRSGISIITEWPQATS